MAGLTSDRLPWAVRVLWLAAGLALVQALSLLAWYWPGTMPDTHTSGVWVALADDAAHGDLYRPLASALRWRQEGGNVRLLAAAGLFAAAFLTKITTVFGLGAFCAWLLWRREWRPAMRLLGWSGIMMLAGVVATLWASNGRMLASF